MKQWKLIFTVLMSLLLVCTCMSALADDCAHKGDTWTQQLEYYPCEGYAVYNVFCGECNALLEANKILTFEQQHAWMKTGDVVKATCTKGSYQLYTCAVCKKTMEDKLSDPAGHSPVMTELIKPTCTTVGKEGVLCQNCNTIVGEVNELPKVDHTWEKSGAYNDPTCEGDGFQWWKCSVCGLDYKAVDADTALGHKYEWATLIESTCTEKGRIGELCRVCNTVKVGSVAEKDLKDHSWKQVGKAVAPTCTADGYSDWECESCGLDYRAPGAAKLGHAWKLTRLEQPTCTKEGKEGNQCTRCKAIDEKTCYAVKKADHKLVTSGVEIAPTCTEPGYQYWKCTVCGESWKLESGKAALGHAPEMTVLIAPTCTSIGKEGVLCKQCDTIVGEVHDLPKLDHAWVMVGKPVAATCTTEAYEMWTCKVCDLGGEHYKKVTGEKLGHKLTEADGAKVVFVKEATCTQEGRGAWECATCKWIDMENSWVVEKKPHDWKVSVITAPTCLKGGESCYECKVCGKTENNFKTEALGHDIQTLAVTKDNCEKFGHKATAYNLCKRCNEITYEAPKAAYDATEAYKANGCEVEGHSEYKYCSICKAIDPKNPKEVYPALTHDYTLVLSKYPADCLNDGYEVRQCKVRNRDGAFCDATTKVVLEKLGHDHGDLWHVLFEATCTAEGKEVNYCLHCGLDPEYRAIAALGHDYYTVKEIKANYEGTTAKFQKATCEKDGWAYALCKRNDCEMTHGYNDNSFVTIPALGHKFGTWQINPYACTEGTVGYRKCLNDGCDKIEKKVYVEAKGHQWVTISGKEPTCTASGKIDRVCSVCGLTEKNVWVAPTGHKETTATTAPTCTVAGKEVVTCETCGKEISTKELAATGHVETKDVQTKAPTCTEKGAANVVCVKCDAVVGTKEIAALGHGTTKDVQTKAPTCTEKGAADVICTVCNAKVSVKEIPAVGHGATKTVETAATCTKEGKIEEICTVCNVVVKVTPVAALGHGATTEVETKAPTCTAEGAADVICSVCNEKVETKVLAALGHGETEEVTTDATCTEAGKVEELCTVCGEVLNTTEIAALGHDREEVTISVPSAEGPGLVRIQCSVCGIELGAYFVPYTNDKVNVLVNTDGVMVADLVDELGNIEETRVTLIDLAVEGKTEYVLVAEDSFVIGYMTVEVANGKLTVSYKLVADAQLSDALLTVYANVEELKAQTGTEYVAETVELDIASTFGTDTKIILAFTGAASFDAASCEAYVVDTEAVEAMKLLAD